jgi:hypothetical protein
MLNEILDEEWFLNYSHQDNQLRMFLIQCNISFLWYGKRNFPEIAWFDNGTFGIRYACNTRIREIFLHGLKDYL